jgi:hypothetical protein
MKRSKNHPTTEFAKNIILRLKSFNSTPSLKDFHALIIYFLNANSVMSGEEETKDRFLAQLEMTLLSE